MISGHEFELLAEGKFQIDDRVFVAKDDDYGDLQIEDIGDDEIACIVKTYANDAVAFLEYHVSSEEFEQLDFNEIFARRPESVTISSI